MGQPSPHRPQPTKGLPDLRAHKDLPVRKGRRVSQDLQDPREIKGQQARRDQQDLKAHKDQQARRELLVHRGHKEPRGLRDRLGL